MIVSMKPPYEITPKILKLITSISEKIGEVNSNYLTKQSPQLRKQNRIKTIHSSLKIEGNTLTEEQITALIENKRIIGPKKDVLEVINAFEKYSGEKLDYSIGNRRAGDVEKVFADTKKANEVLGWKATHDLESMITSSWEWEKKLKSIGTNFSKAKV